MARHSKEDLPCVRFGEEPGSPMLIFVKPASDKIEPLAFTLRVAPAKFAAVLFALAAENAPFGNDPANPTNGQMSDTQGGGMGRIYLKLDDGHLMCFCC